jgi:hypothetical protein
MSVPPSSALTSTHLAAEATEVGTNNVALGAKGEKSGDAWMEFMAEIRKLIGISLDGSAG